MLSRLGFAFAVVASLGIGAADAAQRSISGLKFVAPSAPQWKEEAIESGVIYEWKYANPENGHPATAMLLVTATPFFRGDVNTALMQLMDSAGILVGQSPTQSHAGTTTDGCRWPGPCGPEAPASNGGAPSWPWSRCSDHKGWRAPS